MFNLRYSNGSKTIYYRADKSTPNVFAATTDGPETNKFVTSGKSPLKDGTPAFFAFDVINNRGNDYIIGSTFPEFLDPKLSMPLLVASNSGANSPTVPYDYWFFYTNVIDVSSLASDKVDVYFIGWSYDPAKTGLIAARASASVSILTPSISVKVDDVLLLNDTCFDIWTDINKPHLYIDNFGGSKYLLVSIPGRCDAFYKIKIDPTAFSKSTSVSYTDTDRVNVDMFSSAYDYKTQRLFYVYKKYNSDTISLHIFSFSDFAPSPVYKYLTHNDTNPILTYDANTDSLLFSSSDFDHIYKIPGSKIDTPNPPIATLPPKLKSVSSSIVINDFLYLVTFEPDAQLGRIQISTLFCNKFCGTHGYCSGQNLCLCAQGYAFNATTVGNNTCVPKHEVDIVTNIINERGVAIALGILFFIALIAAVAGWVMWWRSRKSQYSQVS